MTPLNAEIECGDEIAHFAVAKWPGDMRGATQIDAPAALWLNSDADAEFAGGDARVFRAPIRERQRAVGFERCVRRPVHGVEQERSVRRAAAREFDRDGSRH